MCEDNPVLDALSVFILLGLAVGVLIAAAVYTLSP